MLRYARIPHPIRGMLTSMWFVPERRRHTGATPHQFALYRVTLGLLIAALLAASPAPELPSETWLEVPRTVRTGLRLVAVLLGLGLSLGLARRGVALASIALCAVAANFEHLDWAVALPLMAHCALVAIPAPGEPWSLALGQRAPGAFSLQPHWSTAAWGVALLTALSQVVAWDQGMGGAVFAAGVLGLGVALVVRGPTLNLVAALTAAAFAAATLAGNLGAGVALWLPTLLAGITQDWLPARPAKEPAPIVFFDGVCGLCQRGMQLIIREDVSGRLKLAPLQGETSRTLLGLAEGAPMDTFVLRDGDHTLERSDAALGIARYLGGIWLLTVPLRYVPRSVRDTVYDWVAANRYAWFGQLDACPIPTPEQRARFLD